MPSTNTSAKKTTLFSLDFLKNYLQLHPQHEDSHMLLENYMETAVNYIEETLGKTLLRRERTITRDNCRFAIPYGPNLQVISVIDGKKTLSPGEYTLTRDRDRVEIEVPFRWKFRTLTVTYRAGYGDTPEEVPSCLKHAVLRVIEFLYHHKGDATDLEKQLDPWLKSQRTYGVRVF